MGRKKQQTEPAGVAEVRTELERGRRTRTKHSPIPQALWDSAVQLAAQHGTNRNAQAPRLDYYCLKSHLNAQASRGRSSCLAGARP